jgi:hypothetical protein
MPPTKSLGTANSEELVVLLFIAPIEGECKPSTLVEIQEHRMFRDRRSHGGEVGSSVRTPVKKRERTVAYEIRLSTRVSSDRFALSGKVRFLLPF